MEYAAILSAHWLEAVTAVYLIGMVLYGHYRGFIRLAVSAVSILIVLAAVNAAIPRVMDWMKNHTAIYENMKNVTAEHMGIDELLEKMQVGENLQREDEWQIIDGLPLPEQMRAKLAENNNAEVYKEMGISYFEEYIAGYLTDMILKTVMFVILFIAGYIALHLLVRWLDLIAKLPILSGINQIAGAVLGGAQAMVFIWIACLLIAVLSGTGFGTYILLRIADSKWLTWIYEHNMLTYLLFGWIYGIV